MAEYIKRETVVEKLNKLCDSVCPYPNKAHYAKCGSCLLSDALIVVEDDVPEADVVERTCYDGIFWESDVMRQQLSDIGKSLGEKMDDVVERKRGTWLFNNLNGMTTGNNWICSECGNGVAYKDHFCSNCGAKME